MHNDFFSLSYQLLSFVRSLSIQDFVPNQSSLGAQSSVVVNVDRQHLKHEGRFLRRIHNPPIETNIYIYNRRKERIKLIRNVGVGDRASIYDSFRLSLALFDVLNCR